LIVKGTRKCLSIDQQEWLRLVQKYYNSEQSAAQFCLEHNLHPKTFDNNRRKLHHLVNMPKKREDSPSEFVAVEKTTKPNTKTEQQPTSTLPTELCLEAGPALFAYPVMSLLGGRLFY
jgi:hypothetical protein